MKRIKLIPLFFLLTVAAVYLILLSDSRKNSSPVNEYSIERKISDQPESIFWECLSRDF